MVDNRSEIDKQVDQLVETVKRVHPKANTDDIRRAYQLAKKAHGDQKRRSGEPYIMHPVAVALLLADYHMDVDSIIAALLHDVIEDTDYEYEDISREFNEDIAYMVESVSKITRMNYQSKEETQAEYVRKMVIAMSNDLRIVMIKLFDRLHNMRTLEYMSTSKQYQKSRETLEIYAPIANRLGIQSIKDELEDLSFKYINPSAYKTLEEQISKKVGEEQDSINQIISDVQKVINRAGIKAEVKGRIKHLYGVHEKMQKKNLRFDEVYDLFAVRIITDSVEDVYASLGVIHTTWNAIPGRMKDYITQPKANGYQSFHTTVMGPTGNPLEIQIRTKEMHIQDEYGIAAHWKYKEKPRKNETSFDKRFDEEISWLHQLIDWSDDFDSASDFLETMKIDILDELVFVYTPNGDIVQLPAHSTPLDFAYRIHTDIGNHCTGAVVNGRIAPLDYELQIGDIVKIITSKNSKGPNRRWLDIVKSAHARNKIRQFIKKSNKEANIAYGKEVYKKAIRGRKNAKQLTKAKYLENVAKALNYKTVNDLYLALGVTAIKPSTVIEKLELLYPELFPNQKSNLPVIGKINELSKPAVEVEGLKGIETHLAKCCNPIPGDNIIGYITNQHHVSIHRTDCKNFSNITDLSRIVEVGWSDLPTDREFLTELNIETISKPGALVDVMQPFYTRNFPINSTSSKTEDSVDIFKIVCEVRNREDLDSLIKDLKKIPIVLQVERG